VSSFGPTDLFLIIAKADKGYYPMIAFIVLLVVLTAVLFLAGAFERTDAPNGRAEEAGNEDWEYGDDWKRGSPDTADSENTIEYVEVLRGDTGRGYDDSVMIDLVGYLGSRGLRATYDSFSLGAEVGAMKTYVLKVESGKEDEALAYLKEKG
jgi:hypothetical protein